LRHAEGGVPYHKIKTDREGKIMVKLIPGVRGSGKTKLLIEAILKAKAESKGNVVAVQVGKSLNSQIKHDVRLINIEDHDVSGCEAMHGFLEGILASDYDCTHIFVDGILKIVGRDFKEVGAMLDKVNKNSNGTQVIMTFSADLNELDENIKKYL
jgi:Ni2+-binding GTPase involved in maturation of urease and hydrogenase